MSDHLDALVARVRACRRCVEQPRGAPLPHEPRPVLQVSATASLAICGQAPGTRVHASGRPFTDPSGDRLRVWTGLTEAVFYDASRVAIVPMGFCFPGLDPDGADKPPRRECAPMWHRELFAHLTNLRLVLLVGGHAQRWHLGTRASLTATVADWRQHIATPVVSLCYLPLPHPSWRNTGWLKRHPWFETELLPVVRARVAEAVEVS